jgi:hypothetical protein
VLPGCGLVVPSLFLSSYISQWLTAIIVPDRRHKQQLCNTRLHNSGKLYPRLQALITDPGDFGKFQPTRTSVRKLRRPAVGMVGNLLRDFQTPAGK